MHETQTIIAHYEEQTEDDALLEDEAGIEPSETVMNVPHDLVPKVRGADCKTTELNAIPLSYEASPWGRRSYCVVCLASLAARVAGSKTSRSRRKQKPSKKRTFGEERSQCGPLFHEISRAAGPPKQTTKGDGLPHKMNSIVS
jgi:hypothetical protein